MKRVIGIITLGPLVWLLARWLSRQSPEWWRNRLRPLLPKRMLDTRPDSSATPNAAPEQPDTGPSAPPGYEPPGPNDPESGETTLSPEGSPGAHRVVPN